MKHKYVLLIRTIMIDLIYEINVRTFIHNAVKLKRIERASIHFLYLDGLFVTNT